MSLASQTVSVTAGASLNVSLSSSAPTGVARTITISGSDSNGNSNFATFNVTVKPPHTPPTVILSVSPQTAIAPAYVTLTAAALASAGYSIQSVQFTENGTLLTPDLDVRTLHLLAGKPAGRRLHVHGNRHR